MGGLRCRTAPTDRDVAGVRRIVESSGFFYPHEVDVAVELVQERLVRGESSGYHFVFADDGDHTIGYACYGPIACTVGSFDLYWIAVEAGHRGRGIGRWLLAEAERAMAAMGARRVYVDTGGRAQYAPTRAFYESCGYRAEARLVDFYAPGDDKIVYVRLLPTT